METQSQTVVLLSAILNPSFLAGFMTGAGFATFFLLLFLSLLAIIFYRFPLSNKVSISKPTGVTLSNKSVKGTLSLTYTRLDDDHDKSFYSGRVKDRETLLRLKE
jgi:hypothetical protein